MKEVKIPPRTFLKQAEYHCDIKNRPRPERSDISEDLAHSRDNIGLTI